MVISKTFFIVVGIAIGIYLLYKIFLGTDKLEQEYDVQYNKILTSDEYKVKGQYEK